MYLYHLSFNSWLINTISWHRITAYCTVIQNGIRTHPESFSSATNPAFAFYFPKADSNVTNTSVWHSSINLKKSNKTKRLRDEGSFPQNTWFWKNSYHYNLWESTKCIFFPKSILTKLWQNVIALKIYFVG